MEWDTRLVRCRFLSRSQPLLEVVGLQVVIRL